MTRTTTSLEAATARYAESVHRQATKLAVAKRRGPDAFDIASDIAYKFLATPEALMARYPDPMQFVRAAFRNACVAHDRKQRVQRCEGLRLIEHGDGRKSPARQWISGSATIGEGDDEVFAWSTVGGGSFEDTLVDRIDAHMEFERGTAGMPADQVREVLAVDGQGYEVNEIAVLCGQRRETVSRRVNRNRNRLRQNLVEGRHAKGTPA